MVLTHCTSNKLPVVPVEAGLPQGSATLPLRPTTYFDPSHEAWAWVQVHEGLQRPAQYLRQSPSFFFATACNATWIVAFSLALC